MTAGHDDRPSWYLTGRLSLWKGHNCNIKPPPPPPPPQPPPPPMIIPWTMIHSMDDRPKIINFSSITNGRYRRTNVWRAIGGRSSMEWAIHGWFTGDRPWMIDGRLTGDHPWNGRLTDDWRTIDGHQWNWRSSMDDWRSIGGRSPMKGTIDGRLPVIHGMDNRPWCCPTDQVWHPVTINEWGYPSP